MLKERNNICCTIVEYCVPSHGKTCTSTFSLVLQTKEKCSTHTRTCVLLHRIAWYVIIVFHNASNLNRTTLTIIHFNETTIVNRYSQKLLCARFIFPERFITLISFSKADLASCVESRRFISGQCFFLGKHLISWRTKKQLYVSRSSLEAEYRALIFLATC